MFLSCNLPPAVWQSKSCSLVQDTACKDTACKAAGRDFLCQVFNIFCGSSSMRMISSKGSCLPSFCMLQILDSYLCVRVSNLGLSRLNPNDAVSFFHSNLPLVVDVLLR